MRAGLAASAIWRVKVAMPLMRCRHDPPAPPSYPVSARVNAQPAGAQPAQPSQAGARWRGTQQAQPLTCMKFKATRSAVKMAMAAALRPTPDATPHGRLS